MPDAPEQVPATISWDAIRALAVAVGVRESARRLGISEDMVRKRCEREGWLKDPTIREATMKSVKERAQSAHLVPSRHLSPAQLVAAEITALGAKSRLSLARGLSKAASHVESMDGQEIVADSQNVKNVAQTANLVHGWQESAPQVRLRLDILQGEPVSESGPVIDVDSSVVFDGEASEECDL